MGSIFHSLRGWICEMLELILLILSGGYVWPSTCLALKLERNSSEKQTALKSQEIAPKLEISDYFNHVDLLVFRMLGNSDYIKCSWWTTSVAWVVRTNMLETTMLHGSYLQSLLPVSENNLGLKNMLYGNSCFGAKLGQSDRLIPHVLTDYA